MQNVFSSEEEISRQGCKYFEQRLVAEKENLGISLSSSNCRFKFLNRACCNMSTFLCVLYDVDFLCMMHRKRGPWGLPLFEFRKASFFAWSVLGQTKRRRLLPVRVAWSPLPSWAESDMRRALDEAELLLLYLSWREEAERGGERQRERGRGVKRRHFISDYFISAWPIQVYSSYSTVHYDMFTKWIDFKQKMTPNHTVSISPTEQWLVNDRFSITHDQCMFCTIVHSPQLIIIPSEGEMASS